MAHYGTIPGADDYAREHGYSGWTDAPSSPPDKKSAALTRASMFIDGTYGGRFPGKRTGGRDQELAWPRTGATDQDGNKIPDDVVPIEIVHATYEAAVRELESPGSLQPDLERGGSIKRLKAGSVEIEYADGSSPSTVWQAIDGILRPLIGGDSSTAIKWMKRA